MKAVARVLLPTVTFLLIHILVWNVIAYMYPEGVAYAVVPLKRWRQGQRPGMLTLEVTSLVMV